MTLHQIYVLCLTLCVLGGCGALLWVFFKHLTPSTRRLIYIHAAKNTGLTLLLLLMFGNNILAMLLGTAVYYGAINALSCVYQPFVHTRFYIRHLQFSYGWLCALIVCLGMHVFFKNKTFLSSFHVDLSSTSLLSSLDFVVCFDSYNAVFILITACIGFIVSWYAQDYIKQEPQQLSFLRLLHAFILSMLLLLLSGSAWSLLLGWELIGVTSFFLISFYSTNLRSFRAGLKAFLINKVSDVGIYCFCLGHYFNNMLAFPNTTTHTYWDTFHLYTETSTTLNPIQHTMLIGVVIACLCKSAQIGFHVWLPDSMEAPVPASALIHSATLVSAGIFLLGRFLPLLQLYPSLLAIIVGIGGITSIYGALIACYQTDVKKILAYSTISHCGILLVLLCCAPQFIFLLYFAAHGLFKALSFVFVGRLLQHTFARQDMRTFGGLNKQQTSIMMLLGGGVYALGGAPFFFGFLNKTLYLQYLFALPYGYAMWVVCSVGCGVLGLVYATRLFYFSGVGRASLVSLKGMYYVWICVTFTSWTHSIYPTPLRWWLLFLSILGSAGCVLGLYYVFVPLETFQWITANIIQPCGSVWPTNSPIISFCFLIGFGSVVWGLWYYFMPQWRFLLPYCTGFYIFMVYLILFFF